ncbi:MAG: hypothetical protein K8T25_23650 [Planctomycetia bacterium]|nr:hypothetical protein [Planctomycetia bacterium]
MNVPANARSRQDNDLNIAHIEEEIRSYVDERARTSVEESFNGLLVAEAERVSCANRTTYLQAVLPCSTCNKNAHTVSAGPSSR